MEKLSGYGEDFSRCIRVIGCCQVYQGYWLLPGVSGLLVVARCIRVIGRCQVYQGYWLLPGVSGLLGSHVHQGYWTLPGVSGLLVVARCVKVIGRGANMPEFCCDWQVTVTNQNQTKQI